METTHRKIELQSPLDLQYLISNIRTSAQNKINTALPTSSTDPANTEDPLRKRVEELVEEFISATFTSARPNISVNGLELPSVQDASSSSASATDSAIMEEVSENYEPFDTRIPERLRALEAQREMLAEQVAGLRREAPGQYARNYQELWGRECKEEDEKMEEQRRMMMEDVESDGARLDVYGPGAERWDDTRRVWERGTEGLMELKGGLTETVAKLERARDVLEVMDEK